LYTLKNLEDQVLAWLDEAGDTGTTQTNVRNAINFAHQQRCNLDRWTFMQSPPLAFNLVSGQTCYTIDSAFGRPLYFFNITKNEFLIEVPTRELESHSNWRAAATGLSFSYSGMSPVETQPTAASVLTVVSTSVSDVGVTKAVVVTGRTTSGIRSETIVPNGTTPVAGQIEFSYVTALSLTGEWAGWATVTSNSGAVTNISLYPGEIARQYPEIRLLWVPDSADEIEYRFFVQPRKLENDNDIPDIPYPHSQVLVWDALLLLSAYDNQTEGGRVRIWEQARNQMELQMRQTYLEGQTVGSRVRYVRSVDDGQSFL
jgi:hypothetical protein